MIEPEVLAAYLRRSYQAVDGLWFVRVEEASGFSEALDMDRRVWEVMAKIQARKAQEVLKAPGHSLAELVRCFSLKLTADGFEFETQVSEGEARFVLHNCPWLEILHRAEREHLASRIAEVMCVTEGEGWAREYGEAYHFRAPRLACCQAGGACEWVFAREEGGTAAGH